MDNSLTPQQQSNLIEDALETHPLAAIPRDITADVMARIHTIPAPRPFRFVWTDILLGVVLSLCVVAIGFSLLNLPALVVAQIRKELILSYQYMLVNARWLIPVMAFGSAGFFAALTIPYLRQELIKKST